MPPDLDIKLKQYIRDHFESLMAEQIRIARVHGWVAGIIIREGYELDKFIEDLWKHLSDMNYDDFKKSITMSEQNEK